MHDRSAPPSPHPSGKICDLNHRRTSKIGSTRTSMRFWQKLVSTGILAAVVVLPLLSVAMCAPESASSKHCPPDCPMMANMSSGHQSMNLKSENSRPCCTIRSSKPAPVTESKTVAPVASVEPATVSVPLVSTANGYPTVAFEASSPPIIDSQARLCTFQI